MAFLLFDLKVDTLPSKCSITHLSKNNNYRDSKFIDKPAFICAKVFLLLTFRLLLPLLEPSFIYSPVKSLAIWATASTTSSFNLELFSYETISY